MSFHVVIVLLSSFQILSLCADWGNLYLATLEICPVLVKEDLVLVFFCFKVPIDLSTSKFEDSSSFCS